MHHDEQTLRPRIEAAFEQGGLDAICRLMVGLLNEQETRHHAELAALHTRHLAELAALDARYQGVIATLEARIAELEKSRNKNSSNSSKPPSSDGLKRTSSLRSKKTGRKPGGQPGHPGQTLRQSKTPDITVPVPLNQCPECGADLSDQPVVAEEKRQVFDLPPIKIQVTEYQAQRKICPRCGLHVSAAFPADVCAPAQYGPGMQAVMGYLNVRQVIPCERVAEVCQDLFGHRPSAGSVVQAVVRCAERVAPAVEDISVILKSEPVLHADETGVRCIGKTHWLHVVSTATHTLYSHSPKRGVEGFTVAGVLPGYTGTVVHDFWGPYDVLECEHSRCNAHLLRELKAFAEEGQEWAENLMVTLLAMKKATDEARQNESAEVEETERRRLETLYDKWVEIGFEAHPERIKPPGRRGRMKQSREYNLLKRMRDKREEVLRFLHDLNVPFDNNQAERDLRMIKVQQKVSGCFRSEQGAKRFCEFSSYISTVRKLGMNLIDSIKSALTGAVASLTT